MTRSAVAVALFPLLLAGCGSDASGPPEGPPSLSILSGDGQTAGISSELQVPLVVQASSSAGTPLAGWVVKWTVSGGGQVVASNQVGGFPYAASSTDDSGRAQAQWSLGKSGAQEVQASIYYNSSSGISTVSVTFSATLAGSTSPAQERPAILHYDGASWSVVYHPAVVQGVVTLLSIWGSSSSSIFAVGEYCGVEAFVKYEGTSWSPDAPEGPPGCTGLGPIENNVAGSSASNIFRIQSGNLPPSGSASEVQHFDGTSWTNAYGHGCPSGSPSCGFRLNATWTDSPNNAVVVGNLGFIVHYNGSSWTEATSGTTSNLLSVWGVASATTPRVFAVGDAGTILTYDGTSWQAQSSGTTQTLRSVWGTSATDVFAVGDGGLILHYDGTRWSTQNSSGHTLYGVWGTSPTSVFAVGDGPTVLYYDGSTWTAKSVGIPIDLRAVWGSGANDVYAVGKAQ
ncbi:MAG TPA: hypothetical protein VJ840_16675 [Gemmatimonadaceae bacterium]|nr:hypothetical protein [Gemmatimonadaceae bacterium]